MIREVGWLDAERYRAIADDIASGPVVITDERIAHIQFRHPGDWESFHSHIRDVIESPDFILRDNSPATAVCVLLFAPDDAEKHLRLTLRLHTSEDLPGREHSVLTFQNINRKEYGRLSRSKKVVYRKV